VILAQLSDLHVRPPGDLMGGVVDTTPMVERALRAVAALVPRPDAVVISGDITDRGRAEEYAIAAPLIARHLDGLPVYVIPGNHDERSRFRAAFAGFPGVTTHPDYVQYVVDDLPMRLVMLDSVVAGSHAGELGPERLEWLDATLAAAPDRPTILVLHHPPIPCAIPPADRIMLRDGPALAAVVARHRQVERILCGHHHQAFTGRMGHAIVHATPSVAHAGVFDLVSDQDAFVLAPPAYSVHVTASDGGLISHAVLVDAFPGPHPY